MSEDLMREIHMVSPAWAAAFSRATQAPLLPCHSCGHVHGAPGCAVTVDGGRCGCLIKVSQ